MIQRVQTIHLFLAAISALLFLISPYGQIAEAALIPLDYTFLSVFSILSILLSAATILKYTNRKLQKKLIWVGLGIVDILIIFLLYQYFFLEATLSFQLGIGLIFLLFIPIFLVLAMKGINNDEKIIKSMDRLR
jgi:hypothetical protein